MSRGLTLLELAITLAVLAILGTLAVPSVGGRLQRQRLQFTAETLAADISNGRFEAAQHGDALRVVGRAGNEWCWAVTRAENCECGTTQSCQLRRVTVADHAGVSMLQPPAATLNPDGGISTERVAVFESAAGQRIEVRVTPSGRPHLCSPTGAWPSMPAC